MLQYLPSIAALRDLVVSRQLRAGLEAIHPLLFRLFQVRCGPDHVSFSLSLSLCCLSLSPSRLTALVICAVDYRYQQMSHRVVAGARSLEIPGYAVAICVEELSAREGGSLSDAEGAVRW